MFDNVISLKGPHLLLAGMGVLDRLGEQAGELGATRALVITDKGVMGTDTGDKVKALLEANDISVEFFTGVSPDPAIADAEAALEAAKAGDFNLIIGLGGGSPMDVAAIAAVLLTNPGTVHDYFGIGLVKNPGVPTILIPTTAGTGAEMTPNAILSDPDENLKKAVVSPYILPRVAIIDPMLTVSMPPSVTSSSGIDALTHAIESYTSNNASILTDMFAREAITLIGRSLRTAVANGNDLKARYDMTIGSAYAGISLANAGVTAVHALAYPLGGQYHIPHGVANGLLLPYVMEFNAPGSVAKFADVARLMGERVEELSLLDQAYVAAESVKALYCDLAIPQSLTELNVPEDGIPGMSAAAMNVTRLMGNNPRTMTVEDVAAIYTKAL